MGSPSIFCGRLRSRLGVAHILIVVAALGCATPPPVPEEALPPGLPWEEAPSDVTGTFSFPEEETIGLLVPGDLLGISIYGHSDLDSQVRIPPSGIIDLPLLGPVKAKGQTVPDLAASLRAAYEKDFLTRADVSVSVVEFSPRQVFILGSVRKEGAYPIPTGKRLDLLQLLSLAGGFAETADQEDIVVLRREGKTQRVVRVSYHGLLRAAGEEGKTFLLVPDDTVIVGEEERVYVLGRVNNSGAFPIGEGGLTVIQAVSLAGGFQRIASPEGTIVIRAASGGERRTFRVPVGTILDDESRRDFRLSGGDIVYVPESLF